MTATIGRRLACLEAARTAAALADFRAAFHAWVARPDPLTLEEAEARLAEMQAALSPAERAQGERLAGALDALLEPATAPAGIARAAAAIGVAGAYNVGPGTPPYLVLAALAAHFRQVAD